MLPSPPHLSRASATHRTFTPFKSRLTVGHATLKPSTPTTLPPTRRTVYGTPAAATWTLSLTPAAVMCACGAEERCRSSRGSPC
ncbi:hypothetical protein TNIN_304981 [Trichonephila inaurata madagascariensis]|uniref:Uncharacterized protein n=1 Tax=Trichonephila inaurata madagascariensis TaxID=2747483 RepID=A0A8X6MHI0_9ARAC|nr:hypothetical protein TNIN_304981 [Trichonephila inaurata madagascariensis]